MESAKVVSFQVRHEEFYFLGIENLLTENADFDAFWRNFFEKGGYSKIEPYEKDANFINIWLTKASGEQIYFQGKIVNEEAEVPAGYVLEKFPAGEYLVVTTEWLPSYEASMKHINHDYYEDAQIPAGYRRHNEVDSGIFLMERWGHETADGYRYEFWLPIEKI